MALRDRQGKGSAQGSQRRGDQPQPEHGDGRFQGWRRQGGEHPRTTLHRHAGSACPAFPAAPARPVADTFHHGCLSPIVRAGEIRPDTGRSRDLSQGPAPGRVRYRRDDRRPGSPGLWHLRNPGQGRGLHRTRWRQA